ncbi:hypothetical protein VTJ83DRAFT_6690 [Remersonia thermophila]|uniref:Histidine acid phosphatase n=1 Tax=Remersonia thermophila TaxID=72144 RepID=A0ABR4D695_9PEZI
MHALGAAFRDRYVRLSRSDEHVGIVGVRPKTLDNSQLFIQASADGCSATSAIAFMQGLYPPFPQVSCDRTVPEHTRLADNSIVNYPMFGYQYPIIRTSDPDRDPDSIWIHGFRRCNKHETSLLSFPHDPLADVLHQSSKTLYGRLWNQVFHDVFSPSEATFFNAHELFGYAVYRWVHDAGIHSALTLGDLEQLQELAWQEQTLKYAPTTGSRNSTEKLVSTMAGRTLVSRVAALFSENMASRGERNKLNLAFTSHEPFLSFFALAGLLSGPSSHLFTQLPTPGATLIFELFSVNADEMNGAESLNNSDSEDHADDWCSSNRRDGETAEVESSNQPGPEDPEDDHGHDESSNHDEVGSDSDSYKPSEQHNTDDNEHTSYEERSPTSNLHSSKLRRRRSISTVAYPSVDDLYVRFLYRNGSADPKLPPVPCPLFGNTRTAIPWRYFNEMAWAVGVANATSWCAACESDAFFCKGAEERREPHPKLAAFIGASAATGVLVMLNMML